MAELGRSLRASADGSVYNDDDDDGGRAATTTGAAETDARTTGSIHTCGWC